MINTSLYYKACVVGIIILLLFSFIKSYKINTTSYNTDYRSRIVGERNLLRDKTPYFTNYIKGENLYYWGNTTICNDEHTVFYVTATPLQLYLYYPLAKINYEAGRWVWFFLQWFMYLYIIIFAITEFKITTAFAGLKITAIFLLLLFLSFTPYWYFHLDRGQFYIEYPFLLLVFFQLVSGKKLTAVKNILTAIFLAVLIGIRPQWVIIALPLLLMKKNNVVLLLVLLFGIFLFVSFLKNDIHYWFDFNKMIGISFANDGKMHETACKELENFVMNVEGCKNYGHINDYSNGLAQRSLMDILLGAKKNISYNYYLLLNVIITGIYLSVMALINFRFKEYMNWRNILMISSFFVFLLEFVTPAYRNGYAFIQILLPVILFIDADLKNKKEYLIFCLLLILFLLVVRYSNGSVMQYIGIDTFLYLFFMISMFLHPPFKKYS